MRTYFNKRQNKKLKRRKDTQEQQCVNYLNSSLIYTIMRTCDWKPELNTFLYLIKKDNKTSKKHEITIHKVNLVYHIFTDIWILRVTMPSFLGKCLQQKHLKALKELVSTIPLRMVYLIQNELAFDLELPHLGSKASNLCI